jgi:DNA polymerase III sliding clamp (beta) subunit (PCNA family)
MTQTIDNPTEQQSEIKTFVLPARNTLQAIRALAGVVSTDDLRPVLKDIQVTIKAGTATFTATDSFRLGWVDLDAPDCADGEVRIPPELIKRLVKTFTRCQVAKIDPAMPIVFEPGEYRCGAFCNGETFVGEASYGGNYPDWRQLVPDESSYTVEAAAFNPGYLSALGAIAKEIGADASVPVKVASMHALKPGVFTLTVADFGTFTYLLMPVRID